MTDEDKQIISEILYYAACEIDIATMKGFSSVFFPIRQSDLRLGKEITEELMGRWKCQAFFKPGLEGILIKLR